MLTVLIARYNILAKRGSGVRLETNENEEKKGGRNYGLICYESVS